MTRDRDQQPRRAASADDAFLEVTGALARSEGRRARYAAAAAATPPHGRGKDSATPGGATAEPSHDHDDTARPRTTDEGEEAEGPPGEPAVSLEEVRDHLRRRAIFLRELAEARELRRRVTPHRSRRARIHAALRRRTFRIN
jgi:hypothetical protein